MMSEYGIHEYDAGVLAAERPVADFFEDAPPIPPPRPPVHLGAWGPDGDLHGIASKAGEPQQRSGRQEAYENLLNQYLLR